MSKWMILALSALLGAGVLGLLVQTAAGCCAGAEESPATQPAAKSNEPTVTLRVKGMTCASCAIAVRTALRRVDGVKDAKVSYEEARAIVTCDPSKVAVEKLIDAVDKAGYEASLPETTGERSPAPVE